MRCATTGSRSSARAAAIGGSGSYGLRTVAAWCGARARWCVTAASRVAVTMPGDRGAGEEEHAREQQEDEEDVRAGCGEELGRGPEERLAHEAAVVLEVGESRKPSRGVSPGPRPSEPAARPSISAADEAERCRCATDGPRGSSAGSRSARRRRTASTGARVADAAEHEQDRVRERLAHLAPGPAEIEDAREERREARPAPRPIRSQWRCSSTGSSRSRRPGPCGHDDASCGAAIGHKACIRRQIARTLPTMGTMSGRPRVLVVEDDADIAGVLRRSLDKEGYEVRVAADGEDALERVGRVRARCGRAGPRASEARRDGGGPPACAPRATCPS